MIHLHGSSLHTGASYIERNPYVKLIRHGFALDQAKLSDVVAVIRGVDHICVVQLASVHKHIIDLQKKRDGTIW